MNIIYNGEIYLKRGPEIIDPRNSIEYQELEDTISDIEFELSKENPDLSKAEYLEPLQAYKDILDSKKSITNYSGTNNFWELYTNDGKHIAMKSNEQHPLIKDYNSVEEMNKDFIKLTEFLKKSTYVGMEFVRTKPIVTYDNKFDRSFMKINPLLEEEKHIVLYAMQDLFLIRVIDDPFIKDRYELVNKEEKQNNKKMKHLVSFIVKLIFLFIVLFHCSSFSNTSFNLVTIFVNNCSKINLLSTFCNF